MQTPVCAASFLPGANISEVHDLPEGHAWRAYCVVAFRNRSVSGSQLIKPPLVDAQQHLQYDQARRTEYAVPPTLACLAVAAPRWTGLCARPSPSPCDLTTLDSAADAWEPRDPWERLGNTSADPGGSVDYGATRAKGPDHCRMSACPEPRRCEGLGGPGNTNGTPSAYSVRCDPDWGLGNGTLVWCWLHCGLFGGGPLDGSRLARLSIARPPGSFWLRSRVSKPLGCRGSGRNGFLEGAILRPRRAG